MTANVNLTMMGLLVSALSGPKTSQEAKLFLFQTCQIMQARYFLGG